MYQSHPPAYEKIGANYNHHRAAEPTIVRELVRLLGLASGSTIADIGAGTGNYSNALARLGFQIQAIEPSSVMRSQTIQTFGVEWHQGTAEALPLPDNSVHGIVCTLAVHHFHSLEKAALEMRRVCATGPIVVLTIDPRFGEYFWLAEFFPTIHERLFSAFPLINTVCEKLSIANCGRTENVNYFLPHDAIDITMHSGWNRPEIYLDENYRRSMSGFALASPEDVEPGLAALQTALASGEWDRRHGHLRSQLTLDLGFRFIKLVGSAA